MESVPTPEPTDHAARGAALPPATLDGWYTLHQLFRIDWEAQAAPPIVAARERVQTLARFLGDVDFDPSAGWSEAYRMVGGGVDLMLLHFRPTLEALTETSEAIARSCLGDILRLDHESLSVVELGLYGVTLEVASRVDPEDHEAFETALRETLDAERDKEYVRRRLEPRQPEDMPYVCYYPMDRRRDADRNWYALPIETRAELMRTHGAIGRRFAGRISQVIGGSIGLADHEWAVTLFAPDPLVFKELITAMRYDEASAEYAEFGRFHVGRKMDDLSALLPRES